MTETKPDIRQQLQSLILKLQEKSGAKAVKDLLDPKTPQPYRHKAPLVKQYTLITQNTTCKHCGHRYTRKYRLSKNDPEHIYTDEHKNVIIVNHNQCDEHMNIDTWVRCCDQCDNYIAKLPRYQLEATYMQMLKTGSMNISATPARPWPIHMPCQETLTKTTAVPWTEGSWET